MATDYKLSLPAAIIINLNIMLGTGIFLNSVPLAKFVGSWSFLPYAIIGVLMVPLILAMAILLNYYEKSNFYDIGSSALSNFWGFLSTWCYFIVKPASVALMIHFFSFLMQQLIIPLSLVPLFVLDILIITLFVILNLLNMRVGRSILTAFLCLKAIPIILIIIVGLVYSVPQIFNFESVSFSGLLLSFPLALFACFGFEATLSLSRQIQDSQKNAPRAIIISYLVAVSVYLFYQLGYYAGIDKVVLSTINSFDGILYFLQSVNFGSQQLRLLLYFCMGASALGGAYGILFSNAWNLYTLADNKQLFGSSYIARKNSSGIAYWCIFIEALLCIGYLITTNAHQITLQQLSVLGSAIAYTISMCAFAVLAWGVFKNMYYKLIAVLALVNCLLFIAFCINGFITHGLSALGIFVVLSALGIFMYWLMHKRSASELG